MFTKTKLLVALSILVLFFSSSAQATPPESETDYFPFYEEWIDCGGWWVVTEGTIRERFTTFFDRNGEPARIHVGLLVVESRWLNSEHPEIYIQQGSNGRGENASYWFDFNTGNERGSGAGYRITVPGYGPVIMDIGHWTWDGENFTSHGLFAIPDDFTGSVFCEVLAFD